MNGEPPKDGEEMDGEPPMDGEEMAADGEEEESGGGMIPAAIVYPVMIAALVYKLAVVSLVGVAW
jgi:hypothetical protein